jgi:hypothetical protein
MDVDVDDEDEDDDDVRLEKGMDAAAGVDRCKNNERADQKLRFSIIIWFLFHNTLTAFGAIMMMHDSYKD